MNNKSLKRFIFLLVLMMALIIPSNAYAWPEQPGGVYSYQFGSPLKYKNDNIAWTTEPGVTDIEWNIRENHGIHILFL